MMLTFISTIGKSRVLMALALVALLLGWSGCNKADDREVPLGPSSPQAPTEMVHLSFGLDELPDELLQTQARMLLEDAGRGAGVDYLISPGERYRLFVLFEQTRPSGSVVRRVSQGWLVVGQRTSGAKSPYQARSYDLPLPSGIRPSEGNVRITGAIGVSSLDDSGVAVIPASGAIIDTEGKYVVPMYFPFTALSPDREYLTASGTTSRGWVASDIHLKTYGAFVGVEIENPHDATYMPRQISFATSAFHTSGSMNLLQTGSDGSPLWLPEDLNSSIYKLIGTNYYASNALGVLRKQRELYVKYADYDAKTNMVKRTLKTISYNDDEANTVSATTEEGGETAIRHEQVIDLRQVGIAPQSSKAFFTWIKPNPRVKKANVKVGVYATLTTIRDYAVMGLAQPEIEESLTATTLQEGKTHRFKLTLPAPAPSYVASLPEDIANDIKLRVVSGTATSHQGADDISKAFDGNMSTNWHSSWNNRRANYFPITATLNFQEAQDVDYLVYYPRISGYNGYWKEVDIEYSLDGTNFVRLLSKDFKGLSTPTRVTFDQRVRAKAFRFIVRSGHGDGKGFASAAEIEFYQKNSSSFDYRSIFTDETCSELLPGVTDEQIRAIREPFYRHLADQMSQNRYEREFRIAQYKPYPHPNIQARTGKRRPFTLLDNPTGIYVEADETLVVFVGDTHGFDDLSLRVMNLDKPGDDGFSQVSVYPIARGVNKLRMDRRGLVYVMYHSNSLDTSLLRPIKIHFASGTVNGYFDSQNPTHQGRFSELLGKAKGKYFDVLGRYAHLTFPITGFQRYTAGRGKELIDIYDKVVYNEALLHGYYKYDRIPRNRVYLHVMYKAYMYATDYHTAYNETTLSAILNPSALEEQSIWGPAHEIGHVHQTHGLKWLGMTECTVNIPSAYVQTYAFNKPCRLQVERLSSPNNPSHNRYTRAWNNFYIPESQPAHSLERDVFCRLVPFWQLELYMGKAKGNTPSKRSDKGGFYPDVYEYLRQIDNQGWSDGKQQVEFAYIASLKSGYNLTKFFERWGFFAPIDISVTDYRTARMTVTQSMADEVRRRIAALNLPEPDGAIEYITDNTADLYRTYPAVVAGTASRNGRRLNFSNWQNVVAYEVYNTSGRLIYVSDGVFLPSSTASLTIGEDWQAGFTVKAVSARGDRVVIPIS